MALLLDVSIPTRREALGTAGPAVHLRPRRHYGPTCAARRHRVGRRAISITAMERTLSDGIPTPPGPIAATVDRLLAAVEAGAGDSVGALYADDALLDATVPGWRLTRRGPTAIAAEYAHWFADPGHFEELDRVPIDSGELVTYMLAWEEHGVPHAAHHCHRLTVDPTTSRITADRVFCGGRWNAALLASMADAEHAS